MTAPSMAAFDRSWTAWASVCGPVGGGHGLLDVVDVDAALRTGDAIARIRFDPQLGDGLGVLRTQTSSEPGPSPCVYSVIPALELAQLNTPPVRRTLNSYPSAPAKGPGSSRIRSGRRAGCRGCCAGGDHGGAEERVHGACGCGAGGPVPRHPSRALDPCMAGHMAHSTIARLIDFLASPAPRRTPRRHPALRAPRRDRRGSWHAYGLFRGQREEVGRGAGWMWATSMVWAIGHLTGVWALSSRFGVAGEQMARGAARGGGGGLPSGAFHRRFEGRGKLGGQHKCPRCANHRELIEAVVGSGEIVRS